jgi:hypothetical protein
MITKSGEINFVIYWLFLSITIFCPRWLINNNDPVFKQTALEGRRAGRQGYCGSETCRPLSLPGLDFLIYPGDDTNLIPLLVPLFDSFIPNTGEMRLESCRAAAKIRDMRDLLGTRPYFYFRNRLATELEMYLNPDFNPDCSFAHQFSGTDLNELYGKTRVFSDWNPNFMGR